MGNLDRSKSPVPPHPAPMMGAPQPCSKCRLKRSPANRAARRRASLSRACQISCRAITSHPLPNGRARSLHRSQCNRKYHGVAFLQSRIFTENSATKQPAYVSYVWSKLPRYYAPTMADASGSTSAIRKVIPPSGSTSASEGPGGATSRSRNITSS